LAAGACDRVCYKSCGQKTEIAENTVSYPPR
jgi:hypothetical protein